MSGASLLFASLEEELKAWTALGSQPHFWWRDDDLVGNTPNFARSVEWANRLQIQGLFAVIPGLADDTLADVTCRSDLVVVAQHGWKHLNAESPGAENSEFGASRELSSGLLDLEHGYRRMSGLFGDFFFPVFVPPWNRIADAYLPLLGALGFVGISAYQQRPGEQINDLACANAHLDILDWSTNPVSVRPVDRLLAQLIETLVRKRNSQHDLDEPIGILTHHRSMPDDEGWHFLAKVVDLVRRHGGVWERPREIFERTAVPVTSPQVQALVEIDRFYSNADPWKYFDSEEDSKRRLNILASIPQRDYPRTLEVGCGNGFITLNLPGREVVGVDVSRPAVEHARRAAAAREDAARFSFFAGSLNELDSDTIGKFDLIMLAGVLYPHYIGGAWVRVQEVLESLLAPGGIVVSCHIDKWVEGGLSLNLVRESRFAYRQYVQSIKVYVK